ncbi:hypothetical protein [Phaffia rhodozyma]|uniref:Uncharacterized protein n=1 Tax=Phaffia rhodozyma TaxID=264483 RepID=A0A0F7SXG2_PHARH|nr:hypothetical protein [Phaffia rhodozyma]
MQSEKDGSPLCSGGNVTRLLTLVADRPSGRDRSQRSLVAVAVAKCILVGSDRQRLDMFADGADDIVQRQR